MHSQKGFTLLEVMIAIAVTGILGASVAGAISQLWNAYAVSKNHVIAINQVENAIYWIGRDVRMSQSIGLSGGNGFPLTLEWWDEDTHVLTTYTLDSGTLSRDSNIAPNHMAIAEHIDARAERTVYDDDIAPIADGLTLRITASLTKHRNVSETRVVEIIPRSELVKWR